LLALGVKPEVAKHIAEVGIAGLGPNDARLVPELDVDVPGHRALFNALMAGHPGDLKKLDQYYEAQLLWDEAMARTSAEWLQVRSPGRKLVIMAGSAHCHRSAIPTRIARRTGLTVVSLLTVETGEAVKPATEPKSAEEHVVSGYDYQMVFSR
jgi:uncharacterized iron-regulated protein